jgi:hypothetical protein
MADVFAAKEDEIEDSLDALTRVPDQKGILFFVNGKVVGFDLLSRAAAYEVLHDKLVKSYVMDALLQKTSANRNATLDDARAFVTETQSCSEKRYKSAGLGWDYRFDGTRIVGSALVHNASVVHAAFFRAHDGIGRMANYTRRRAYRARSAAHPS